jgi:hypothetical protein
LNKLRNLIIEIAVATGLTVILGLTRGYSGLFMEVLPLLYVVVLGEIVARYALSDHSE